MGNSVVRDRVMWDRIMRNCIMRDRVMEARQCVFVLDKGCFFLAGEDE